MQEQSPEVFRSGTAPGCKAAENKRGHRIVANPPAFP